MIDNSHYGKKVKFSKRYVRKTEKRITPYNKFFKESVNATWKIWTRIPYNGFGIFLGTRFLQEGTREFDGEYGWVFNPIGRFKVALVSPGYGVNPVYIPLDSIELEG